jgi:hypothetical protein
MSIKIYIPPQYAGNLVEIDESTTGVPDVLHSPPSGRWRAIHNHDTETVNIFAPENEVYRFINTDGDDPSDVYGAVLNGKLTANDNFFSKVVDTELGLTASQTSGESGTVTVTRAADSGSVFSGAPPTFDGITTDADGDVTALVVNGEGTGLEVGDVISFTFVNDASTDTGDVITLTALTENDIQLKEGFYVLKATTRKQILSLAAGESAYVNVSKIEVQAADNGNDGKVIAFFG